MSPCTLHPSTFGRRVVVGNPDHDPAEILWPARKTGRDRVAATGRSVEVTA